jgi:hypothetical protein
MFNPVLPESLRTDPTMVGAPSNCEPTSFARGEPLSTVGASISRTEPWPSVRTACNPVLPRLSTTEPWILGAGPEGDPMSLAVREPLVIAGASTNLTVVPAFTGNDGRAAGNSETGIWLGSAVFCRTCPEVISIGCGPSFTLAALTDIAGALRGSASSRSFGAASARREASDAISIA